MNLKEMAAQLGVSASSISIVRKGKPGVSSATRRKIQLALEENGFSYDAYSQDDMHPTIAARAASAKKQDRSICLLKHAHSALLTDNNEGFVAGLIDPIILALTDKGYTLEMKSVNSTEYPAFLHSFSESAFDGLLVIATEMTQDELQLLSQVPIPTVVLDSDYPFIPHSSVTMNNRQLAWQAVACLAKNGEVGYLRSSQATGNFAARAVGYQDAVHSFHLSASPHLVFSLTPSLNGAEADMRQYLAAGRAIPPALFADNDVIAIGCMRAFQQHGIRIPEDTQIIGVDDTLLSQVITPSLSSMQISRAQMANQAVKMLLEAISSPARLKMHIHIDAQLIYRQSVIRHA